MTKRHLLNLAIIHSFLPLFLGGLVYILFRSKSLIMFEWFTYLKLDRLLDSLRAHLIGFKAFLPQWIYYSIPDGLWIYSLTSALIIYWHDNLKFGRYWLIIPFVLGICVEILQGFKLFPGTFDWIDLIISIISFSASIIITNKHLSKYEK